MKSPRKLPPFQRILVILGYAVAGWASISALIYAVTFLHELVSGALT